MVIASLTLTLSMCLSCGCNDVAKSISVKALEEKTTIIIDSFDSLYNLSDYNLSNEDELTLFKTNIMNYIGTYNLLQNDYYQELERIITSDDNYNKVTNYQMSLIRSELPFELKMNYLANLQMDYNENGVLNLDKTYDVLPGVEDLVPENPILPKTTRIKISKDYVYETGIGSGGGRTTPSKLPIKSNNDNNASFSFNGTFDGNTFVGLNFNPETCKCVYNFFAEKINNYATKPKSTEMYGFSKDLITIVFAYKTPLAIYKAITSSEIYKSVVQFVNHMIMVLKTTLIGKIIGLLCVCVLICIVGILIAMFICGFFEVGFMVGWIVKNMVNREWIAKVYY